MKTWNAGKITLNRTVITAVVGALLAGGCGKGGAGPAGVAPVPGPAPAPAAAANHAADEKAADKAAQAWLAHLDAARYAQSWKASAPAFQKAINAEFWVTTAQAVRAPLGRLQTRALLSARYAAQMPGAPDGEYVVLQYRSAFAKKKDAVETVTPMRVQGGQWKVSGYYLK